MRKPLNSWYITNPHLAPGYGVFGVHMGLDLRASIGTAVYAPGAGTVKIVDNVGLKLLEVLIEGKLHRFLHLSKNIMSVGQTFSEGQVIAYTGNTGGVAAHLHWDIRKNGTAWNRSKNDYYSPLSLITSSGGEEMFKTDAEVREAYQLLRGSIATAGERKAWIGLSKQRFFRVAKPEADNYRKQLAGVKKALADLKAQPAKTIIKEVTKIVEVPIEKITIKEVEVVKEVEAQYTWQRIIDWVMAKLQR